jgi:hypothetical protein
MRCFTCRGAVAELLGYALAIHDLLHGKPARYDPQRDRVTPKKRQKRYV